MPLGSFNLVIDADRLDGTNETKARVLLTLQGSSFLLDDNRFRTLTHLAERNRNGRLHPVSLPATIPLPTDVTTGTSTEIGYDITVTTSYGTKIVTGFAARPDGATLYLDEVTTRETVTVNESAENAARAEAAAADAEAAAVSVQATQAVFDGRLSDDALDFKFNQGRIVVPANQMAATSGAPTLSVRGGIWPAWALDANVLESVGAVVTLPNHWATFDVIARGVNVIASTGNVVLRTLHTARADGDDVTTGYTTADVTLAAAGLNIRQSVKLRSNLTADAAKSHAIRIQRLATDAADTLTNDFGITAIELVATSYVPYIPPAVDPETPETTGIAAFRKADNDSLAGLRVFQQAPPPADDTIDETYNYWPVTDAATGQDFTTSTWTGGNRWSFKWANRCNYGDAWNKRPNPFPAPSVKIGTQECRATFTTVARANAATQSQIRYMLGNDAATYQAPWIAVGGLAGDFITDAEFRANPATYATTDFVHGSTTYKVMVDKIVLPVPRFVDGSNPELQPGVVLDYEVQDSRTPAASTSFLTDVAADVHAAGRQLYLYTNPLNGASAVYNGLDATNLPTLLGLVDFLSVLLWSGSKEGSVPLSYANQVAMLGTLDAAAWTKLVITFELGNPGTTLTDAQWVHDKLREAGTSHPGKVMFWRNLAAMGASATSATNDKIAAIIAP